MNKYNFKLQKKPMDRLEEYSLSMNQNDFNQRAFLELINHASINLGKELYTNLFTRAGKRIRTI